VLAKELLEGAGVYAVLGEAVVGARLGVVDAVVIGVVCGDDDDESALGARVFVELANLAGDVGACVEESPGVNLAIRCSKSIILDEWRARGSY